MVTVALPIVERCSLTRCRTVAALFHEISFSFPKIKTSKATRLASASCATSPSGAADASSLPLTIHRYSSSRFVFFLFFSFFLCIAFSRTCNFSLGSAYIFFSLGVSFVFVLFFFFGTTPFVIVAGDALCNWRQWAQRHATMPSSPHPAIRFIGQADSAS